MNEAMDSSVKTVVLQPTPRQDEETLWQSGELGYHSPEALTQTLVMIIVKHLKIRSSQAHRFYITINHNISSLNFAPIMHLTTPIKREIDKSIIKFRKRQLVTQHQVNNVYSVIWKCLTLKRSKFSIRPIRLNCLRSIVTVIPVAMLSVVK